MSPPRRAELDEDDIRSRAARGSRPRTRRRPAHAEATRAFVAGVDRGRYRCVLEDRPVTAMKARELGRGNIVVGDTVSLAGDVSGAPGTLARVVRIEPRHGVLRRSADDTDPVERVIVANADQMLIVSALADPPPQLRLIDRFLAAAYDAEIEPVLCLTKSDLASPDEVLPVYAPLGVRFIVLGRPLREPALAELRTLLAGKISVLVGSSGVGKSTLVNLLVPDAARAVGVVSPVTGRGRHTSSSVVALPLPPPPPLPPPLPLPRRRRRRRRRRRPRPMSEYPILEYPISEFLLGAGGSSTRRGYAASGLGICPRSMLSRPFPTWSMSRPTARRGAITSGLTACWRRRLARTVRSRPGSIRCVDCCAALKEQTAPNPTTGNHRTGHNPGGRR